jgi:hypothetical protein
MKLVLSFSGLSVDDFDLTGHYLTHHEGYATSIMFTLKNCAIICPGTSTPAAIRHVLFKQIFGQDLPHAKFTFRDRFTIMFLNYSQLENIVNPQRSIALISDLPSYARDLSLFLPLIEDQIRRNIDSLPPDHDILIVPEDLSRKFSNKFSRQSTCAHIICITPEDGPPDESFITTLQNKLNRNSNPFLKFHNSFPLPIYPDVPTFRTSMLGPMSLPTYHTLELELNSQSDYSHGLDPQLLKVIKPHDIGKILAIQLTERSQSLEHPSPCIL